MKLSEIQLMWKDDSVINKQRLSDEAIRTPILHSKYIDLLMDAKRLNVETVNDYLLVKKSMARYYRGEMTKEELDELGLEQWQYNKPLKTEMEEFLKTDKHVLTQAEKVEYVDNVISFIESVLGQIKARDYQIKNAIQWEMFINGK